MASSHRTPEGRWLEPLTAQFTMLCLACLAKGVGPRGQNMVPRKELGHEPGEESRLQNARNYCMSINCFLSVLSSQRQRSGIIEIVMKLSWVASKPPWCLDSHQQVFSTFLPFEERTPLHDFFMLLGENKLAKQEKQISKMTLSETCTKKACHPPGKKNKG